MDGLRSCPGPGSVPLAATSHPRYQESRHVASPPSPISLRPCPMPSVAPAMGGPSSRMVAVFLVSRLVLCAVTSLLQGTSTPGVAAATAAAKHQDDQAADDDPEQPGLPHRNHPFSESTDVLRMRHAGGKDWCEIPEATVNPRHLPGGAEQGMRGGTQSVKNILWTRQYFRRRLPWTPRRVVQLSNSARKINRIVRHVACTQRRRRSVTNEGRMSESRYAMPAPGADLGGVPIAAGRSLKGGGSCGSGTGAGTWADSE